MRSFSNKHYFLFRASIKKVCFKKKNLYNLLFSSSLIFYVLIEFL